MPPPSGTKGERIVPQKHGISKQPMVFQHQVLTRHAAITVVFVIVAEGFFLKLLQLLNKPGSKIYRIF